jgi:hypothetical protein
MILLDLLFAAIVALLLTFVFAGACRRCGPWESALWFFVIVLLVTWVGGVWAEPVGPPLWGIYWVPFLGMGLLVALLLAAATPTPRPPERLPEAKEQPTTDTGAPSAAVTTALALSWLFWALLVALLFAVFVHYFIGLAS